VIEMTNQMVADLVGKITEMLLLKFDNQIALEENEEVKRGLEAGKSLISEFRKGVGG
jgi:hypothetical protein